MDTDIIGAIVFNYSDKLVFICRYCLEAKGWTGPEGGETTITRDMLSDKSEEDLEREYRCADCGRVGDNIFV